MHGKAELARSGQTAQLGVGEATPGKVVWHAEWSYRVTTAITIENPSSEPDGAFVQYCVALTLTTIPENLCYLDPI